MLILAGRYYFETRTACICRECHRFADIPGTIVHAPSCSEAVLGAHLTSRALDFAICAPEYHASLDEAGDRFCRMCGQRLSQ